MRGFLEANGGPILITAGYALGTIVSKGSYNKLSQQLHEQSSQINQKHSEIKSDVRCQHIRQRRYLEDLTKKVDDGNLLQAILIGIVSTVLWAAVLYCIVTLVFRVFSKALFRIIRGMIRCWDFLIVAVGCSMETLSVHLRYCWKPLTIGGLRAYWTVIHVSVQYWRAIKTRGTQCRDKISGFWQQFKESKIVFTFEMVYAIWAAKQSIDDSAMEGLQDLGPNLAHGFKDYVAFAFQKHK